jgi:hypothetical protein
VFFLADPGWLVSASVFGRVTMSRASFSPGPCVDWWVAPVHELGIFFFQKMGWF